MDLEEYLWANGVQQSMVDYLKMYFDGRTTVSQTVHDTMNKLFFSYIVVGGMPEVVQTYVDTHDIAKVVTKQTKIMELYRLDIAKYAEGSDKPKIRTIFDAIPSQHNDMNRRFFLNRVDPNGRQLRYAKASSGWSRPEWHCPAITLPPPSRPYNSTRSTAFLSCSWGMWGFCVCPVWKMYSLPSFRGTCSSIWGVF